MYKIFCYILYLIFSHRYPGGLAWQLRISRVDIRRSEPLYKLHNFLVAETAAGGVSRQETVSMIPPVVLQVEPHHKVSFFAVYILNTTNYYDNISQVI